MGYCWVSAILSLPQAAEDISVFVEGRTKINNIVDSKKTVFL
jgi:hypothetical protein